MRGFSPLAVALILFLAGCSVSETPNATPSLAAAPTGATGVPGELAPTRPISSPTGVSPPTNTAALLPSSVPLNATPTAAPPVSSPSSSGATPTRVAAAPATRSVPPAVSISLPPGFAISIFASGLAVPRNVAIGPDGSLYVVERGAGRVTRLPDLNRDGVADSVEVVASGFNQPSSLAFYKDGSLYVSTATQVYRLTEPDANGVYQKREVIIDGLPEGGHITRTLLFSPDWSSLFVQVGSFCNVCVEADSRRATIMRFNADGSGGSIYARGLRNAVGLVFRPGTNELWATNNGTDNLGDNQPPDTVQIVTPGQDYGWPRCQAGTIVDPQFGGPGACDGVAQSPVKIQAHSAALGLAFYTGTLFSVDYRGDLYVALHGSIYRSVLTGYKIVRVHLSNGQPGAAQDFATGWLAGGSPRGRPVDLVTAPDGSLYVSDDSTGTIYRIYYSP